jgi:hypothetical protein
MNDTNKKTGVSFECTQKQRDSYIKAAGGRKLAVWIREVLDEAVKNPKRKSPIIADNDADDSIGNRI